MTDYDRKTERHARQAKMWAGIAVGLAVLGGVCWLIGHLIRLAA